MLDIFAKEKNLQSFRINQFNKQYYQEYINSWEELTTWPKELREKLKVEIPFSRLKLQKLKESRSEGTQKALFTTEKGNFVESVLIKEGDRNTVCVSCMSGCPVGCTFCATGQMGLDEVLDAHQIVDQVLFFARILKTSSKHITNIVYMGMGEPMLNLEHVPHSIQILTDKEKFGLSRRRVTISTSGYIPQLRKFLDMDLGVKVAISLHSPTQKLRDVLMPSVSKTNPLNELFRLLDEDVVRRNKRITYEYVLLKDVNDSLGDARELVELLKDRLALVNLINYNPTPNSTYKRSENSEEFLEYLTNNGINATIRKSYGSDIEGACGQLAQKS